jgi:hypothetical protein
LANKRPIKILLVCLLTTIIIDALITRFFMMNGLAMEGNPFLRNWVKTDFFLPFKLAVGVLIIYALWMVYKWYPRAVTWCTILLLALYGVVVCWNLVALV